MTTVGDGAAPRFLAELRVKGATALLVLDGELDHDTVDLLAEQLDEALATPGCAALVVDCARLGFCDSTGLNALLTARLRAEEQGVGLYLAALRNPVARMFSITGVDAVFHIHPDVEGALAAAG